MTTIFRALKSLIQPTLPPPNSQEMAKITKSIDLIIQQNPITIFSKSYCPYCTRAKSFLRTKLSQPPFKTTNSTDGRLIKIIEIDQLPSSEFKDISSSDLQSTLAQKLGKKSCTVPQIFINNQHIGGCDDLLSYEKRDALDPILAQILTP